MRLSGAQRASHPLAAVLVSVLLTAGLLISGGGRASAAGGTDVNNAGVFELDGNVTHEAATTPPYDWSDLFTSTGQPKQVAGLSSSTFVPDPTTNDSAFITGTSKDPIDITNWQCTTKPVTPKDEIQNSYAAAFIAQPGSPVAGHVLLYMALERGTVTGTSNAGFWILRKPTACDPATGTFVNPTTGTPVGHTDGDILLFASFAGGGTTATISLYTWKSSCTPGASGCTSTSATGGLSAPVNGEDCPTSNLNLCGIANGTGPITTPWAPGSVGTNGFFESGIDLTATLGSAELSSGCFATFLSDTRASPSVTAELHDFNSGSFPLCVAPKLTTTAAQTSQLVGTAMTSDTATLSGFVGNVTGETVAFKLFGPFTTPPTSNFCTTSPAPTPLFSGSAPVNASGVATISDPNTLNTVATYYWVASYPGDQSTGGLNEPAQSGCTDEPVTVIKASPTITTLASPSTGTAGVNIASLSDTATFHGTTTTPPTGSVSFALYSDAACLVPVSGVSGLGTISTTAGVTTATFTTSWTPPAPGTYNWVASYGGDANNNGFMTGCGDSNESIVIIKASPTITTLASPSTGTAGVNIASLSDTATFHGTTTTPPTGSLSFALYSDAACLVPVSGVSGLGTISTTAGVTTATFTTSWTPPAPGTYNWVASYGGDANNNGFMTGCGDSNESITVGKASPTITTLASPSTGTAGVNIASLSDTATFHGTTTTPPTGSVSFALYSDAACLVPVSGVSGLGTISTTAGVTTATFTTSWTPPAPGTYNWVASYGGDANNNGFMTGCGDSNESITVGKASPTITTLASPSTGTAGVNIASLSDTATFHGTTTTPPTGSVSFALYSDAACLVPVSGVSGLGTISTTAGVTTATFTTSWTPPAPGTYNWVASYGGDANNNGFMTGCGDSNESITVGKASPTITTLASPSTGTAGVNIASLSDTATFHGTTTTPPTGSVSFALYSDAACLVPVSGVSGLGTISTTAGVTTATFTTSWTPPAPGTYNWVASYGGDANNNGFMTGCGDSNESIVIIKASPTITTLASPSTGTAGVNIASLSDTATFHGTTTTPPTGSVSFALYSDAACLVPVSGVSGLGTISTTAGVTTATFTTSWTPPAPGTYNWVASYGGDANNNGFMTGCGDSNESIVIIKASPTITTLASPSTGTAGVNIASLSDTATFHGTTTTPPTGSVSFALYSDAACLVPVSGVSGLGTISTTAGVTTATFTTSWTPPAPGTYNWVASYGGDANNNGFMTGCGDSNESITVGKASPTITTLASPSTGTAGVNIASLSDTATFHGTTTTPPTGSVSFALYSDAACLVPVSGVSGLGTISTTAGVTTATFTTSWTPPAPGTYNWVASYGGDANNNGFMTGCGDSNESIVIIKASPTITTLASPSTGTAGVNIASLSDTATFHGTTTTPPTGSVSFALYSDAACLVPVSGVSGLGTISTTAGVTTATFTTSWTPPAPGTYNWVASYGGDANNNGFMTGCGDSNESITVGKASPTITTLASPSTGTAGVNIASLSDTATFHGTTTTPPTGSVSFALYSDAACLVPVSGVSGLGTISTTAGVTTATFTTSWTPPAPGTYNWVASYGGDANNNGFMTGCGDSNESITVGKASPTITTLASPSTGTAGVNIASLSDTATFHGTTTTPPTGSVSFALYSDAACLVPVSGVSGLGTISTTAGVTTATFTTSWTPPAPGTYNWVASYGGDANNNGFMTGCGDSNESITVGKASPTITTLASPSTGTAGVNIASLSDTATFHGTTTTPPTGSVSFALYSDAACLVPVSGVSGLGTISTTAGVTTATFTTSWTPPAPGTYNWVASYGGDANNNGFMTGCGDSNESIVIIKASPTITTLASPSTGTAGVNIASLSDTATFHGTTTTPPTGSVSFALYSDAACLVPVSGVSGLGTISTTAGVTTATFTTSWTPPAPGTYNWVASYGGDANNNGFMTGCGDSNESITVTGVTGQIAPTNTTCQQFANGTASSLTEVDYQTKGQATIFNAQPGVFFYFVKVTAPASSFTVDVLQTIQSGETGPLFGISSTSAFDSSCNTFSSINVTGGSGDDVIAFSNATVGHTYVVAVKYNVKSIVGQSDPNPANITYTFRAKLNSALVAGSPQTLNVVQTG